MDKIIQGSVESLGEVGVVQVFHQAELHLLRQLLLQHSTVDGDPRLQLLLLREDGLLLGEELRPSAYRDVGTPHVVFAAGDDDTTP